MEWNRFTTMESFNLIDLPGDPAPQKPLTEAQFKRSMMVESELRSPFPWSRVALMGGVVLAVVGALVVTFMQNGDLI